MSAREVLLCLLLCGPALVWVLAGVGLGYWYWAPLDPVPSSLVLMSSLVAIVLGLVGSVYCFVKHKPWVCLYQQPTQRDCISVDSTKYDTAPQSSDEYQLAQQREARAHESLRMTAHEIRRPLHRLSFAIQALEDNPHLPEDAPQRQVIHHAMAEISTLVDEALWYARVSHGPLPLQLSRFDVHHVVTQLIAEQQLLYPHHHFECTPGGRTPERFQADRKLFVRALNNLITNAAKYGAGQIMLSWQWSERELLLTVHDDGPGIPLQQRDQVFEPFFTANPGVEVHGGLGLAIVRGIVFSHGGEIQVTESPLGGAAILLCLPLCGGIKRSEY